MRTCYSGGGHSPDISPIAMALYYSIIQRKARPFRFQHSQNFGNNGRYIQKSYMYRRQNFNSVHMKMKLGLTANREYGCNLL